MNIEVNEDKSCVILKLSGNIVGGSDDDEFNAIITRMIGENKRNIVVDLGEVNYVNSNGISVIFRGHRKIRNSGGELKLACLNNKLKRLLSITRLDTLFDIHEDTNSAIVNFEK